MRRIGLFLLAASLCCVPLPADERAETAAEDAERIELPLTIEKLWYRSAGKRREGYLTVSDDGLEFFARKKAFAIPLERIRFISYGTMRGDVDTDWVVLAVGVTAPYDLVGLRDGAKWGFGGRTEQIHRRLRAALRQLSAAQYDVAPGFKSYEDPDHSCAFAIPENWNEYLESLVVTSGRTATGTSVLSEKPIREVQSSPDGGVRAVDDLELLDAILAGESPGFFFERAAAARGMRCSGWSDGARERILQRAREDIALVEGNEIIRAPDASAAGIGGCDALRVVARARRPDGAEIVLELHSVAHGGKLYTFVLRALADRYERHREIYAAALDTVRFGVAGLD